MTRQLFILTIFFVLTTLAGCGQTKPTDKETILKIEMKLSAFGVESDDFPSIDALIDFSKDTSICVKSFYNPAKKGSTYSLSKTEIQSILKLLNISDIKKLKKEYKVVIVDQPSSKTIIYTNRGQYTISDYGLEGEDPLKALYKIVYKF